MPRTAERPLPAGRLTRGEVLAFGAARDRRWAGVYLAWLVKSADGAAWARHLGPVRLGLHAAQEPHHGQHHGRRGRRRHARADGLGRRRRAAATGSRHAVLDRLSLAVPAFHGHRLDLSPTSTPRGPADAAGGRSQPAAGPARRPCWPALALLPVSLLPAVLRPGRRRFTSPGRLLLGAGPVALPLSFLRRLDEASARRLLRASLVYLPRCLLVPVDVAQRFVKRRTRSREFTRESRSMPPAHADHGHGHGAIKLQYQPALAAAQRQADHVAVPVDGDHVLRRADRHVHRDPLRRADLAACRTRCT